VPPSRDVAAMTPRYHKTIKNHTSFSFSGAMSLDYNPSMYRSVKKLSDLARIKNFDQAYTELFLALANGNFNGQIGHE
jgi:hypothetical protein